jgi:heme oxygenase (biliverdin-IX-beta and delta-forming)
MATHSASSKLHDLLRQATKMAHHGLDHHSLLVPLLKTDMSRVQYGDALAALHGVQAAGEGAILAFLAQQPGLFAYAPRLKLPALSSDLSVLQRLPFKTDTPFPIPNSVPALVGVMYTVEGGTQGGQFIARTLRKAGFNDLPFAFFEVYRELNAQCWEEFWQFADRSCSSEDHEVAAQSAVAMFRATHQHLDACQRQLMQANTQ